MYTYHVLVSYSKGNELAYRIVKIEPLGIIEHVISEAGGAALTEKQHACMSPNTESVP